MKRNFIFTTALLMAFVLGLTINNFALCNVSHIGMKVAVVDVSSLIKNSKSIAVLKESQKAKTKELYLFIEKARNDVAKQKDPKTKKQLEEKYNKELNIRRNAVEKDYDAKMKNINANITASIADTAKANKYDIVFAKSVVLYGGKDITKDVALKIK